MLAMGRVTLEIFGCSEVRKVGRLERESFQEGLDVTGCSMRGWDKEERVC